MTARPTPDNEPIACAYFFVGPGLCYGLLTSRLPALKASAAMNESQIGLSLLVMGLAGVVALLAGASLIARFGSRACLRFGVLSIIAALPLVGLTRTPLAFGLCAALFGLCMGLVDVAANAHGIQIERRLKRPCMSSLHAASSLGGLTGSLGGALFAAWGVAPSVNFALLAALYASLSPLASTRLLESPDKPSEDASKDTRAESILALETKIAARLPSPFIVACGLLAMIADAAEGSVAEWGSLFLFSVKGAGEQVAALVFGVFCLATMICRLVGDRLRQRLGDTSLAWGGALLAACGMAIALFSPVSALSLIGYGAMGVGLAPIVPILFSRAGNVPGVSPGKACATVSVFSCCGMLVFPPSLGVLAHRVGLDRALLLVLAMCPLLALGTWGALRNRAAPSEAGDR